ncbi:MAG: pilus assembly protein [Betaproteobacteria bacterium]|nr:pilus assembly protein [Betaproteobacteria bacterium]
MKRARTPGVRRFPLGCGETGQAMAEYLIVLPSLLLLVLGALQFALVFMAKSTLDLAAFDGARNGALYDASTTSIQEGVARGLAPLYQRGMAGSGPSLAGVATAEADALLAAKNPATVDIEQINPSASAFQDFATAISFADDNGNLQTTTAIPNSGLLYQSTTPGTASNESIQDANLLKIHVHYCYPLIVPFVNTTIRIIMSVAGAPSTSSWVLSHATYIGSDTGTWDQACYASGGLPLAAYGTALMQSPAIEN